MFPKLKKTDLDLQALGDELMKRKKELLGEMKKSSATALLHGKPQAHPARKSHLATR